MKDYIFKGIIKKLENNEPNFWLVDATTNEVCCEVFCQSEDESEDDMIFAGYRQISSGYWIDSGERVPVEVSGEL